MAGTFPFSQLSRRMDKLGEFLAKRAINRVIKNSAIAFGNTVVDKTPVDTGKARSNWRASLGASIPGAAREPYAPGKHLGTRETGNANAVKAQQRSNIRLYNARIHKSIFFTNRTDYIETIDGGIGGGRAHGFVAQGIQAMRIAARATPILTGHK